MSADDVVQQINIQVRFTEITDTSDVDEAWFAGCIDGRPQLVKLGGDLDPVPPVDLGPIASAVLSNSRQYGDDSVGHRLVLQTVHG